MLLATVLCCAFSAFAGWQVYAEDGWPAAFVTKNDLLDDYAGKTVILQSNDVHGAVQGYQYIAGLRDELKRRGADVILVDSGDYIQGSKEVSATKGSNAIRMMNKAEYDLATLGNHEFDFSYTTLKELYRNASFGVINDNIMNSDGTNAFDRTRLIEGDVNVGFVGITTPETQTGTSPSNLEGITFLNNRTDPAIFSRANEDITNLKDRGADVVLCLSHLGVDDASAPYRSIDLWQAAKNSGLDYILDGHSHTVMTEGKNGEPVMSTGTKFQNIGMITIDEATGAIDQTAKPALYKITEDSYSNEEVKAESDTIASEIAGIYGIKVGSSEVVLNGERDAQNAAAHGSAFTNGNRDGETNLGDFATDAILWYALKDEKTYDVPKDHIVAVYNGGSFRAGIAKGDITRGDVLEVFPFSNPIEGIYVKGSQLLEALEASTFSYPSPIAGFPHVSGMEYSINIAKAFKPAGTTYPLSKYYPPASIERITIDSINGKPFSAADTYLVVTSSFIADGGDTYGAFRSLPRISIAPLDEDVFSNYISEGLSGVIDSRYSNPAGRIKKLPISIENAKVVLSAASFKYNGKVLKPTVKVSKGLTLAAGTDYTLKWSNASSKNVGTYTVTVTGKGRYNKTVKTTYKIVKAVNPLKIKAGTATLKYRKLKKASRNIAVTKVIRFTKKGKGKMTYKFSFAKKGKKGFKKFFKVNTKTGKVTVKKKLKKGTYKVTVKVRAAGNSNYNASAWKKVTFKVKVIN